MTSNLKWNSDATWDDLAPRQQDIMLCLAKGMTNQEIAEHLGLRLSTVRNNIASIYEFLQVTNRVQALLWVLSIEELAEDVLQSI